jgi:hypothetical protein
MEEIEAVDYMQEKPRILRVEIEARIGKKAYKSLVDSGASKSILKWAALVAMVGERTAKEMLYKEGYVPYFKLADGSMIQSRGQVRLEFWIKGEKFQHVFFVLENCSQQIILGNDFLRDVGACLDYKVGEIRLHTETGEEVRCPFGLSDDFQTPALYSLLYAGADMVIPPFSGKGVIARCSGKAPLGAGKRWGFCMRLPGGHREFLMPNAITELVEGESLVVLSNNTPRPLSVRRGEPVACFVEAKEQDFDLFEIDLETMEWKNVLPSETVAELGKDRLGKDEQLEDGELVEQEESKERKKEPAIQERDGEVCPESRNCSTVECQDHHDTVAARPEGKQRENEPAIQSAMESCALRADIARW